MLGDITFEIRELRISAVSLFVDSFNLIGQQSVKIERQTFIAAEGRAFIEQRVFRVIMNLCSGCRAGVFLTSLSLRTFELS